MVRKMNVALFVPNILCYVRIATSFLGMWYQESHPMSALVIWLMSALLDFFDGLLARKLKQSSRLGVFLDICADNVLRSCIWTSASLQNKDISWFPVLACWIQSIEWCTFLATQTHSTELHWKEVRSRDPRWVQIAFSGGSLLNPYGSWIVYGLFGAPIFAWIPAKLKLTIFLGNTAMCYLWEYIAYSGRMYAFAIECYILMSFINVVIETDSEQQDDVIKKD
jgi:phosphatidylglycerophosphate synthase